MGYAIVHFAIRWFVVYLESSTSFGGKRLILPASKLLWLCYCQYCKWWNRWWHYSPDFLYGTVTITAARRVTAFSVEQIW